MNTRELKILLKQMDSNNIVDDSDIDWIIVESTGVKRSSIILGQEVSACCADHAKNIMKKRLSGMPLAYCVGHQNFYGREFFVSGQTLIPRCETEILVNVILKNVKKGKGLDIGTGSGVIPITLNLENPQIDMTAIDISADALQVAKKNAKAQKASVRFIKSNLFSNLKSGDCRYDFIVSNPPYIKTDDIPNLDAVVKNYEPLLALDGGVDGLDFYKKIIEESPNYLNEKGKIFFELGIDECEEVKNLLSEKFDDINIEKDLNNVARIIYATKK